MRKPSDQKLDSGKVWELGLAATIIYKGLNFEAVPGFNVNRPPHKGGHITSRQSVQAERLLLKLSVQGATYFEVTCTPDTFFWGASYFVMVHNSPQESPLVHLVRGLRINR